MATKSPLAADVAEILYKELLFNQGLDADDVRRAREMLPELLAQLSMILGDANDDTPGGRLAAVLRDQHRDIIDDLSQKSVLERPTLKGMNAEGETHSKVSALHPPEPYCPGSTTRTGKMATHSTDSIDETRLERRGRKLIEKVDKLGK